MKSGLLRISFLAVLLATLFVSCEKQVEETPYTIEAKEYNQKYVLNYFAHRNMEIYYLWNMEVADKLATWKTDDDPETKMDETLYRLEDGTLVDRWSFLTEDIEEAQEYFGGTSKSPGFQFQLWWYDQNHTSIVAVVTYVFNDGPAAEAGIKRGDVITKVNGKTMTGDNYYDVVYKEIYGDAACKLTFLSGDEATITPAKMYEDPVIVYKVFDCGGKKVGYMFYTGFVADSYKRLIEAAKYFKEEGVEELILDLRYNGGGLVKTEETVASMLAPKDAVDASDVFTTEVYNGDLTGDEDDASHFTTKYDFEYSNKKYSYSTADANIGIAKLYVIFTSGSASASEALVTGLAPYIPVEIIGKKSHGKYTTGVLFPAASWYETLKSNIPTRLYSAAKDKAGKWGMYLMIGRYADKNGNTPCMPDGFTPDYEVDDNVLDGKQLGDPEETMLRVALERAGYDFAASPKGKAAKAVAASACELLEHQPEKASDCVRLMLQDDFFNRH